MEVNQTARLDMQLDRGALHVAAQELIEQQRLKPAIEILHGAVTLRSALQDKEHLNGAESKRPPGAAV